MNSIPEAVLKEANDLINLYGNSFQYLGECRGYEVYKFVFPEHKETGFPFVFLYDKEDECVDTITGFDALDIIGKFVHE